MERVLIVGDPHIKVSKLDIGGLLLNKLKDELSNRKYDRLIILGDLFDTYSVIRSEVLSLWSKFFNDISLKGDNVIVLVGNHDYAGQDGGTHALEAFKNQIRVVDSEYKTSIGGQDCVFIPFMRDNEKFEKYCNNIPANTVLFCHQSFNGALLQEGFYDPHGADPFCASHLKRVICGHIHVCQSLNENIYYPGSPHQHSFGEAGQKKAILYASIGKDAMQGCQSEKHIELGMPEFIDIKMNDINTIELPEANILNSYRVVTSGTPQEIAEFWKSDKIKEFKNNVRRLTDKIDVKKDNVINILDEVSSKEDKLEAFIKSKNWRNLHVVLIQKAKEMIYGKY